MDAVKIEGGFRWAADASRARAPGACRMRLVHKEQCSAPGRWLQVGASIAHIWHQQCPPPPRPLPPAHLPTHPAAHVPGPPTRCSNRVKAVRSVVEAGVAVMGHVGLTPQAISVLGGFRPAAQSGAGCMHVAQAACLVAAV